MDNWHTAQVGKLTLYAPDEQSLRMRIEQVQAFAEENRHTLFFWLQELGYIPKTRLW